MEESIQDSIKKYYDLWFTVNNIYEQWAKAHGLTVNTLFVFYTIQDKEGECTQQSISKNLLLPKQTVRSILQSLYKKGYIQVTTDGQDKRNKPISFTDSGKQYAGHLLKELNTFEARVFTDMSCKQRSWLLNGTELLVKNLLISYDKEKLSD